MSHFPDHDGNIAKEMHKEGREHARFLSLIIDTTAMDYTLSKKSTDIRCMKKKCKGKIESKVDTREETINWHCPVCNEAGIISGWQGTRCDNRL